MFQRSVLFYHCRRSDAWMLDNDTRSKGTLHAPVIFVTTSLFLCGTTGPRNEFVMNVMIIRYLISTFTMKDGI
jgi:hypothetical protein